MSRLRTQYVEAAQVALHYNQYSLEEALGLSAAERTLLLAVVHHSESERWDRLGRMLGTSWELRDLIREDSTATNGRVPTHIDVPLLLAMAPQFMKTVSEEYKKKYSHTLQAGVGGGPIVEIASMDSRSARELYKKISQQLASAPG